MTKARLLTLLVLAAAIAAIFGCHHGVGLSDGGYW
jgi:hypothetical protein